MLSKEELIKCLEQCSPPRLPSEKTEASCENCFLGCGGHATIVCREVLEATLYYLKESDGVNRSSMEGQIFDIPEQYISQSLKKYGDISEMLLICTEECSELIKAISKQRRISRHPVFSVTPEQARAQIVEEVTHVAICLGMLKKIFKITQEEIESQVYHKACLNRYDQNEYIYKSDMYINVSKVRKSIEASG